MEAQKPEEPDHGIRLPGGGAALAGILNVRPWRWSIWGQPLIFIGGWLRFPTMKTKSPNPAAPTKPIMARTWVHSFSPGGGEDVEILDNFHHPRFAGQGFKDEAIRLAMLETHYRAPLDLTGQDWRGAKPLRWLW